MWLFVLCRGGLGTYLNPGMLFQKLIDLIRIRGQADLYPFFFVLSHGHLGHFLTMFLRVASKRSFSGFQN
jgi:hypothetical protein